MKAIDCGKCKGHKHYRGGSMDGLVHHLTIAHPSDFPKSFGTLKRQGQRSWYVRDEAASSGTEVVYRCIGVGAECPAQQEKS
jgi:hypothetical protein